MGESLLTFMSSNNCSYTIIVDSSGSITLPVFNTVKLCVSGIIKKIPKECKISVINFSSDSKIVSEFKNNKEQLENDVEKDLIFIGGGTNLISALELASKRIEMFQSDKEIKNVIILITDGEPDEDPTYLTIEQIKNGIEFLGIGVGNVVKSEFQEMLPGQPIFMFDTYSSLCEYISSTSNNNNLPLSYKVYPTNNKIQRTNETLYLNFEISPAINKDTFEAGTIVITILENDYYFGYIADVDEDLNSSKPYIISMILKVKNNSKTKELPEKINFDIKIKNIVYTGYFHMDYAWYCGDLEYEDNINIMVEGQIGNGKSSLLNLLFNLLTSNQLIENCFLTSRNSGHVTCAIEYNPISNLLDKKPRDRDFLPIYQDIIDKIKIALVDKPGMTYLAGNQDDNISMLLASRGCYEHGMSKDKILAGPPNPIFAIHSFIFVVSLKCFIGEESDLKMVKTKIDECINKAKIKPILAITFCDHFSSEELEACKEDIEKLPIDKENVFYVSSYINNDTKRDPIKDHSAWKILKCAFEMGKQTIESARCKDANQEYYKNIMSSPYKSPTKSNYNYNYNNNNSLVGESLSSVEPLDNVSNENSNNESIKSPLKPWIISVKHEISKKTLKFKVSPKLTINNFKLQIAEQFKFEIDPTEFCLEDDDGCILSSDSTIDEVLENNSKITINRSN